MMKKRILKKVGSYLIIAIMIFTSLITLSTPIGAEKTEELFKQEPYGPENPAADCYTSSTKIPHPLYEDFWGIPSPIGGIQWWGQSGTYSGVWNTCDPEGMTFKIIFYEDNNGVPGNIISEYIQINPSITPTGLMYEYEGHVGEFELQYFEAQLQPECTISEGWISIVSTGSDNGCGFLWANSPDGNSNSFQSRGGLQQLGTDFAFILTTSPPIPDLTCNGAITWTGVQTEELVVSSFTVQNTGEEASLLNWEIVEHPVWGDNWMFSPSHGNDLTPQDGEITVEVSVEAPKTEDITWEGQITIINKNNDEDFEVIPVSLTTSKYKTINMLFLMFLRNHPNLFPLFQRLLL
jgi:hypothetical protein